MVRKIVRGLLAMPTRWLVLMGIGAFVGVAALLLRPAAAITCSRTPWSNNTASMECSNCSGCGCDAPFLTPEGVVPFTGELILDFPLYSKRGRLGMRQTTVRWRSMIDGMTQMGRGMVPSWEYTAEKVIVDSGNPNSANGHYVNIRLPSGAIHVHNWNGSAYVATSCGDTDQLSTSSSNYVLTSKYGDLLNFDAQGMIATAVDRHGNIVTTTYNSSRLLQSMSNERAESTSVTLNSDDFIEELDDPWVFTYDSNGNLTSITSPATADQGSGITTTLGYDGSNRLTSVQDGRGNTTSYAYVSGTRKVDSVTRNSQTVSYSYNTGRTDRTDANGNVHRYHYTGNQVTKTDMYVSSTAKYATEYRYSGGYLVTVVFPLGNRIDYTYDSYGNRTQKRRKTTDTSGTSGSDVVENWSYTNNFVTSYQDPHGHVTNYSRNSAGDVTGISFPTVTVPATQSSVTKSFTYNSYGQITQVTDEEGVVTTYTYFSTGANTGLLQRVEVDPTGLDLTTTYGYDSAFNINSATDPRGNATTTTWDSLRRQTGTAAPSPLTAHETVFHYDANGNLVEQSVKNLDKDGSAGTNAWIKTEYTYTPENWLGSIVDETDSTNTRTTAFLYDANGNRIRVTKPESNQVAWTYNERDLVATHVLGYGATGAATTSYGYDDNGNLTILTDPRSKVTTYAYDLFDRKIRTTNALGHYEEIDYDKFTLISEIRRYDATPNPDVLVQKTKRYYDQRDRLWKTEDMRDDPSSSSLSDAVTITERFKTGHVKKVTNPRSKDTTYAYDAAWRLTKTTDGMGNEFSNSYDANGNRTAWSIKEIDGGSDVTHQYEADFDVLNCRTEYREKDRTNGSNTLTTTYGYDSRGNLTYQVDAEGHPTRWTFDDNGRMTKKEVALSSSFATAIVTQWEFDRNNRLVSFKDDASNESIWTYDALDRQATMVYPNTSQDVLYAYDAAGNVTQTTDPAGNVIADTFDDVNQNTSRSVTLATGFVDTTSETRTFDALGRITLNQDDDYKVEYTYAVTGLSSYVYEEKQSYATGTAYTKTVTKTYDANGDKSTEAYPNGLSLAYSYNDVDRYSSISDGTNTIASFTYIGMRPKVTTFQSGATATTSYTGFRDEIARIKHETSTPTTLLDLQYDYNKVHDRKYQRYGSSGSAGDAYAYDWARRLTNAWMGSATPSNPTGTGITYVQKIDYNMDDDGNRTSVVVTPYGQSAATTSYTTNNLNQYTAVGSASPTYDANGNQTDNGTYKFKYNYKNLICEVRSSATNSLVATYKYDAGYRRVEKAVNGGVTERYIYSLLETIGTCDTSGNWKQSFVFGQTIDEVIALEQADILDADSDTDVSETARSYYHRDAIGSVALISSSAQGKVEEFRYDLYGSHAISRNGSSLGADALGQHWTFCSRFFDEESGNVYLRCRYLSPTIGSFLTRDLAGDARPGSIYTYAAASPVNFVDPLGTEEIGPDGKPIPGTSDGPETPPPPIDDKLAKRLLGGKDGASVTDDPDHLCANASFVFTGEEAHKYAFHQYVNWTLEWGDPNFPKTKSSGWHPDTGTVGPNGNAPFYGPQAGGSTSGGMPRRAARDAPGSDKLPRDPEDAKDQARSFRMMVNTFCGVDVGNTTYIRLNYQFLSMVIDLTDKRVVRKWTWGFTIVMDLSKKPPFRTETSPPTDVPTR